MGLDMYLHRDYAISAYSSLAKAGDEGDASLARYSKEFAQAQQLAPILGAPLPEDGGTITVSWPVGYWRKANAIHKWFVDNIGGGVDECQPMQVSKEQLAELLGLCVRVQNDHSLAGELLPTGSGFFFGSTEYDWYYFADITQTIIILKGALDGVGEDTWPSWTYQASW